MIRFERVEKTYSGGHASLRGVSFDVADGELLVLVGPSGCGKTTTLKMINRLIEPTAGKIFIEGRDVALHDAIALRRSIGYVLQRVGLFPHVTVAENVAVVPHLLGWDAATVAARTDELLALLGLEPDRYRDRLPRALSGGQQQRVGLARALAARPRIMLMDEPFGALDPVTRDGLQIELRRIHDALKLTTVLVTHDMTEALLLADRILVMVDGQIAQLGTPEELLTRPASAMVTELLETPTRQLARLEALSRRRADAGRPR